MADDTKKNKPAAELSWDDVKVAEDIYLHAHNKWVGFASTRAQEVGSDAERVQVIFQSLLADAEANRRGYEDRKERYYEQQRAKEAKASARLATVQAWFAAVVTVAAVVQAVAAALQFCGAHHAP